MLERCRFVTKENSAKCVLADGDEDGSCGMLEGETEGLMVVGWGVAATTVLLLLFFSFASKFGGGCAGAAAVVGEAVEFVVSLNCSGSSISGSGLGCAFFCSCFCNSSQ